MSDENPILTERDFVDHLSDRKWRLNNLYNIKNAAGKKILFKMNPVQEFLHDNLHSRNVIPKARKLGMCLDPNTRVLMADLTWRRIDDVLPGEEVVAFDENHGGGKGGYRAMRTATVEAVNKKRARVYRITFDNGKSVVCTAEHRWLTELSNGSYWKYRSIKGEGSGNKKARIVPGVKVRMLMDPWEPTATHEDGWFSGILDGEGSISNEKRLGFQVCVSQVDGPVWERVEKYLRENNYEFKNERDELRRVRRGHKAINKAVVYRMDLAFRLLGTTRPSRFISRRWWEGRRFPNSHAVTVTGVEELGVQRVVDLQTSTKTFVAEGFASHNSTFFSIFNLDQVLFSKNKTAGIIAHRQDDMKKLFRNNILFAVENLHPWMKSYIGKPETSTANEISFDNGGQIFVSLTTRGNTPQFLHISELGYIDRHSPEKSKEIISGSVNSVAIGEGSIVSIESTADNGRNGSFYEICMNAEKARAQGDQLTELDWKIFFFPWFLDPQYQLRNADFMQIPPDTHEYFSALEREGIKLSMEQKRWYVKSKETNREEMFTQFPSTLEEAFSVSLEGAYYAKDVTAVYAESRLAFFPVDPLYPIDTAWDIGVNDSTAIVFFQSIGPEIRFVDFYESNGVGLEHYVKMLREKKYRYGKHILPHDIQVKDLSTGVSRLQFLWDLGINNTIVAPKVFIADGIEKVRLLFPRFRFDKSKAQKVLDSLQTYRKTFDEKTGTWNDAPFHGPESHVCDAVRYLAVVWHENFSSSEVNEWGDPVEGGGVKTVSFFE